MENSEMGTILAPRERPGGRMQWRARWEANGKRVRADWDSTLPAFSNGDEPDRPVARSAKRGGRERADERETEMGYAGGWQTRAVEHVLSQTRGK